MNTSPASPPCLLGGADHAQHDGTNFLRFRRTQLHQRNSQDHPLAARGSLRSMTLQEIPHNKYLSCRLGSVPLLFIFAASGQVGERCTECEVGGRLTSQATLSFHFTSSWAFIFLLPDGHPFPPNKCPQTKFYAAQLRRARHKLVLMLLNDHKDAQ